STILARPNLTGDQRAFLERTMATATVESFMPGADHPEICPDVAHYFPDVTTRRLFLRLGALSAPVYGPRSVCLAASETAHQAIDVSADQPDCNCRGLGLCECGLLDACKPTPGQCRPTNNCGCIWSGACDEAICVSGPGDVLQQLVAKPGGPST